MRRVYVVVEGQTEESFVKEALAEALLPYSVYLTPLLLRRTGGNPTFARLKRDVIVQLKRDDSAYCSTMLDFYRLGTDFPGVPLPANLSGIEKVLRIEQAVKGEIIRELPDLRAELRFLPYIQLHEFEGLLFSDPLAFAQDIYKPDLAASFQDTGRISDSRGYQ
ncbi:MAG TPA: DUF4276 family protein [Candidatus Angelobacter sp.]